jgi:mono/diheme cytochrome c family protein
LKKELLISVLPALVIITVVVLFVYNIYDHGRIVHPGQVLYKAQCAQCHGDNGEGIKTLVPPLTSSGFALKNIDSIPCWIKNGMSHPVIINDTLYDQPMYPNNLDEVQISNVINFMTTEFWHTDREVNSGWVKERLKTCQ